MIALTNEQKSGPQRVVLHADMDAFYASVEQRDDPALRGKAVIVGGTSARGVVTAASYEARAFGVHSAMPGYEARRLCPDGIFISGTMKKYSRESKRLFEIFRSYSPRVQGLSLDEAFLDLTGTGRLMGEPHSIGERLRAEVRERTGLAVSVGIAPVKMVAKIASGSCKPDGLLEIRPGEVRAFLDPLPIGRIWGVGPVAEARLKPATTRRIARRLGARYRPACARRGNQRGRTLPRPALVQRGEYLQHGCQRSWGLELRDHHPLRIRRAAFADGSVSRADCRPQAHTRKANGFGAARLSEPESTGDVARSHR